MSDKEFREMLDSKETVFGGYILECPDLTKEQIMLELM